MDPAQVLAVEIKQYVGEGLQSLVPRVIGQTAEAEKRKGGSREQRKWDEPTFFEELERRKGASLAQVARKLYDWARTKTDRFYWGKGAVDGSVYPMLDDERGKQRLFYLYTSGHVQIPFDSMMASEPFSNSALRMELLRRLNEIDGVALPSDAIKKWPYFVLSRLENQQSLDRFISTMEWAVQQINGGS